MTADHIISWQRWQQLGLDPYGFDEPGNLQPAHGTLGNTGLVNRCPTCDRLCNQTKSNRPPPTGVRPW